MQRRTFGSTDGPFRYIKPNFVEKKKHYNEVLITADTRKLLETAEDALNEPTREFPKAFWEVFAKRCMQSMHLLKPMELAIVARAFDTHGPELKAKHDVYQAIAEQARTSKQFPGLAIWVLTNVLPRRVKPNKVDLAGLLKMMGRQAAQVMYELSPRHAVDVLEALTRAGVRDQGLTARVSKKVAAQLGVPGAFGAEDLAAAASVLAGQEHRDLQTLLGISDAIADLGEQAPSPGVAEAANRVIAALKALEVDEIPARLSQAASALTMEQQPAL